MPSTFPNHTSLFNRLLEGELSPKESASLIEWLGSEELDPEAAQLIMTQLQQPGTRKQVSPEIIYALEAKLPSILEHTRPRPIHGSRFLKSHWLRYAAAIIVLLGTGTYFLLPKKKSRSIPGNEVVTSKTDIQSGKQGAILTLDNGNKIVLDSLGNGVIANQHGSKILLSNGQLAYNTDASITTVVYNTLSTPKGRQFQLVLPDGSKVWLNAASSLRYPTAFTGKERRVEITGEAYFEVAKNEKMPFHVKVNDETEITVLGTHFNINSYQNEASINTTLLEGSVRITNGAGIAVIKPGQQAQVSDQSKDQVKIVSDVNLKKVMAWKDGVFNFDDAKLEEVMRQLERWYDIEVVYEKGIPDVEFIGTMGRNLSLSEVLHGLEKSEVHFRIEGRKLTVMP